MAAHTISRRRNGTNRAYLPVTGTGRDASSHAVPLVTTYSSTVGGTQWAASVTCTASRLKLIIVERSCPLLVVGLTSITMDLMTELKHSWHLLMIRPYSSMAVSIAQALRGLVMTRKEIANLISGIILVVMSADAAGCICPPRSLQ